MKTKDGNEYSEKPLKYWRDQIDRKIINAVHLGMRTGLRGHVDFDPLVTERLHEILTVNQNLRPTEGYENGKRVQYEEQQNDKS